MAKRKISKRKPQRKAKETVRVYSASGNEMKPIHKDCSCFVDYEIIENICNIVYAGLHARLRHRFNYKLGFTKHDLYQELRFVMIRACHSYDSKKAQLNTYLTRCAVNRMKTLLTRTNSEKHKIVVFAFGVPDPVDSSDPEKEWEVKELVLNSLKSTSELTERERAVKLVMDLLQAYRALGTNPKQRDLIQLAKRIRRD